MIRSILEDNRGNLWLGSDKEGVARYDGQGTVELSKLLGFSLGGAAVVPLHVFALAEDKDGNIWSGYFNSHHARLRRRDGE